MRPERATASVDSTAALTAARIGVRREERDQARALDRVGGRRDGREGTLDRRRPGRPVRARRRSRRAPWRGRAHPGSIPRARAPSRAAVAAPAGSPTVRQGVGEDRHRLDPVDRPPPAPGSRPGTLSACACARSGAPDAASATARLPWTTTWVPASLPAFPASSAAWSARSTASRATPCAATCLKMVASRRLRATGLSIWPIVWPAVSNSPTWASATAVVDSSEMRVIGSPGGPWSSSPSRIATRGRFNASAARTGARVARSRSVHVTAVNVGASSAGTTPAMRPSSWPRATSSDSDAAACRQPASSSACRSGGRSGTTAAMTSARSSESASADASRASSASASRSASGPRCARAAIARPPSTPPSARATTRASASVAGPTAGATSMRPRARSLAGPAPARSRIATRTSSSGTRPPRIPTTRAWVIGSPAGPRVRSTWHMPAASSEARVSSRPREPSGSPASFASRSVHAGTTARWRSSAGSNASRRRAADALDLLLDPSLEVVGGRRRAHPPPCAARNRSSSASTSAVELHRRPRRREHRLRRSIARAGPGSARGTAGPTA